jgi:hypothetical protein
MKAAVLGLARRLAFNREGSEAEILRERLYKAEALVSELEKTVGRIDHELNRTRAQLEASETMREIHQRDGVEIEDLLRLAALPELPARPGREKQLAQLIGTTVCEALYIVDALHKSLKTPGDICEFGVAQGATSQLIAAEILNESRDFWLFDSFEGLPAPAKEDRLIDDIFGLGDMAAYAGMMRSPEEEVRSRLDALPFPRERTMIRKGWVNDTIAAGDVPKQVAFAYVDFDFYEPIRDALHYLDSVTAVGAHIVVDDYGFFSEGAQLATDQFVSAAGGRWGLAKPLPLAGHFVTLAKVG